MSNKKAPQAASTEEVLAAAQAELAAAKEVIAGLEKENSELKALNDQLNTAIAEADSKPKSAAETSVKIGKETYTLISPSSYVVVDNVSHLVNAETLKKNPELAKHCLEVGGIFQEQ